MDDNCPWDLAWCKFCGRTIHKKNDTYVKMEPYYFCDNECQLRFREEECIPVKCGKIDRDLNASINLRKYSTGSSSGINGQGDAKVAGSLCEPVGVCEMATKQGSIGHFCHL